MNLCSLAEAKRQVHIYPTNTDHDLDLLQKIEDASAIVMDYLELSAAPTTWLSTDASPAISLVPRNIRSTTLLIVAELFLNRESSSANVLSDTVKSLLRRIRPLGIA